uniref:Uncharacterized protein n=1 Tax=Chromera velia CCMP2878 TaxID=1169474 RepID=A0A0G4ID87_9ALVE|eukprot:Cvel_114.t1-p1 / transcript=Cvel_114.t1 / gene=Cvel_114 / organism=Chromera_velia_CCMP2878 / gene_product=hypothetical protein / transcript_product=hypothetical protein / location=Cvel_scaffold8:183589-184563(+) / protein_length=325 / sequence_SO=supercontig / SO=protein_coding / is_pseudo=false
MERRKLLPEGGARRVGARAYTQRGKLLQGSPRGIYSFFRFPGPPRSNAFGPTGGSWLLSPSAEATAGGATDCCPFPPAAPSLSASTTHSFKNKSSHQCKTQSTNVADRDSHSMADCLERGGRSGAGEVEVDVNGKETERQHVMGGNETDVDINHRSGPVQKNLNMNQPFVNPAIDGTHRAGSKGSSGKGFSVPLLIGSIRNEKEKDEREELTACSAQSPSRSAHTEPDCESRPAALGRAHTVSSRPSVCPGPVAFQRSPSLASSLPGVPSSSFVSVGENGGSGSGGSRGQSSGSIGVGTPGSLFRLKKSNPFSSFLDGHSAAKQI